MNKHYLEYLILGLMVFAIILSTTHGSAVSSNALYAQGGEDEEVTIVDAIGRIVSIKKYPEKIVSLAPSITEMIFYMGLQRYLVGVDSISYNDTYFNISMYVRNYDVVDVGGYWWNAIDVEKIIDVKPDLVLADKGAHQPLLEFFESYNLTVVYLNGGGASSINDIFYDFSIIAKIYDQEEKALRFYDEVIEELDTYRDKLKPYANKSILVIIGVYNGVWVAGKATYIDDILTRLGLVNAAKTTGWKSIGIEQIYEWSPDIIIIASEYVSEDTLRDIGIYNLGVPVIFLDKKGVDSLSRPGPLIMYAPRVLYNALSKNVAASEDLEKGFSSVEYEKVLLYAIPALLIGLVIGYVLAKARR